MIFIHFNVFHSVLNLYLKSWNFDFWVIDEFSWHLLQKITIKKLIITVLENCTTYKNFFNISGNVFLIIKSIKFKSSSTNNGKIDYENKVLLYGHGSIVLESTTKSSWWVIVMDWEWLQIALWSGDNGNEGKFTLVEGENMDGGHSLGT